MRQRPGSRRASRPVSNERVQLHALFRTRTTTRTTEPRTTNDERRTTNDERTTNHEPRTTNHKPRTTPELPYYRALSARHQRRLRCRHTADLPDGPRPHHLRR